MIKEKTYLKHKSDLIRRLRTRIVLAFTETFIKIFGEKSSINPDFFVKFWKFFRYSITIFSNSNKEKDKCYRIDMFKIFYILQ